MRPALTLLAILASAGCGDPLEDRPADWAYLHTAIIAPSCATSGCHAALTATFDLELEDRDTAYRQLLDRGYVVPGDPLRSRVLHLLRGDEVRKPMPPDQPLPPADVDLVELWILEGALP